VARGGYRKPAGPRPPSGPGKFSQRTDANQPQQVPNVGGSDLQYGDRSRLEAAQAAIPIPNAATAVSGTPTPRGPYPGRSGVPDFLFNMPSSQPGTPGTSGLPTGAGPGPEILPSLSAPDEREGVLQFLVFGFGNKDAAVMLDGIRQARQAALSMGPFPGVSPAQPSPQDLSLEPSGPMAAPSLSPTPGPTAPEGEVTAPAPEGQPPVPPAPAGPSEPPPAATAPPGPPPAGGAPSQQ
jgi:hypothetical protein